MSAKIQIMKKRVFLVAYVDECGVKAGHHFFDLSDVDVTNGVGKIAALFLQRNEPTILKERY
jgi:hypothetical protein